MDDAVLYFDIITEDETGVIYINHYSLGYVVRRRYCPLRCATFAGGFFPRDVTSLSGAGTRGRLQRQFPRKFPFLSGTNS